MQIGQPLTSSRVISFRSAIEIQRGRRADLLSLTSQLQLIREMRKLNVHVDDLKLIELENTLAKELQPLLRYVKLAANADISSLDTMFASSSVSLQQQKSKGGMHYYIYSKL